MTHYTRLDNLSNDEVRHIVERLNNRPLKKLSARPPPNHFSKHLMHLHLESMG